MPLFLDKNVEIEGEYISVIEISRGFDKIGERMMKNVV
jgi:hypothetical protein